MKVKKKSIYSRRYDNIRRNRARCLQAVHSTYWRVKMASRDALTYRETHRVFFFQTHFFPVHRITRVRVFATHRVRTSCYYCVLSVLKRTLWARAVHVHAGPVQFVWHRSRFDVVAAADGLKECDVVHYNIGARIYKCL